LRREFLNLVICEILIIKKQIFDFSLCIYGIVKISFANKSR
jgi:hypothetical protein